MRKQDFDRDRDRNEAEEPAPVVCTAQSFARFSRWLEGELAKLERRWQHAAAPSARQTLPRGILRGARSPSMPKPKPK